MSRTRVAGIAAAMLAAGLIVGLAGTAIARDGATAADCAEVMVDHMDGQAMGPGAIGPDMMSPGASGMAGNQHRLHHPDAPSRWNR